MAVVGLLVALAARAHASPADRRGIERGSQRGGAGGLHDAIPDGTDRGFDDAIDGDDGDDDVSVDLPYAVGGSAGADRGRRAGIDALCDCDAPTLSRIAATAPELSTIIARAQSIAGLAGADAPTASWRRRSRWSALIPVISLRVGNSQSWRDILDPAVAASSSSSAPTLNHSLSYDARVAWHLDHLLYDPNEPRFTAFELSRRRERRLLAAVTSRAYFVWLRASVAVERDGRWELRVAEAAAELDALTDGWFSENRGANRRESR
ncbi:MAG TPA: hypothetical protein VMZ53_20095 [Kofleriaceae bacterium]|nr:hypothetical protein [Kofleriaceae bacterium]